MELGLAAGGGSYCPSFALLDDVGDGALGAALGRPVTDGTPEPREYETEPQWWAVTATAGVATDEGGRPAHGEDAHVVRLGQGQGVLLVTDQAATCVLTTGQLLGDARALVLSFDLDEVVAVQPDRPMLRRRARSMTVELSGASWGAVGFAVAGELARHAGMRGAPVHAGDATALVARLSGSSRG